MDIMIMGNQELYVNKLKNQINLLKLFFKKIITLKEYLFIITCKIINFKIIFYLLFFILIDSEFNEFGRNTNGELGIEYN